jgi:class 3 adenylate cyclase
MAYAFLIVLSGFLMKARTSRIVGFMAAAGYLVCFFAGHETLRTVSTSDPMLTRDLHDPFIAILRAGTIALIGFGVGAISRVVHRLIARTVREERARAEVAALFGQYVSHPVVERLLRDKGRLAGERATAAILFSDLRGFTSFSEGRSPEEIVASLNAYFEHMVPAIEREGGIVDKFIGDAIMVVFGGVFTHPDPAGAAVRAARGMRNALAELNREREASGAQRLENGIGIHLGPVVHQCRGGSGANRRARNGRTRVGRARKGDADDGPAFGDRVRERRLRNGGRRRDR